MSFFFNQKCHYRLCLGIWNTYLTASNQMALVFITNYAHVNTNNGPNSDIKIELRWQSIESCHMEDYLVPLFFSRVLPVSKPIVLCL
jgi:hypothetical protein